MQEYCNCRKRMMSRLIARAFRWFVRKLGLLIVIVAILVGASVLQSEWQEHREIQASLGQQATERSHRVPARTGCDRRRASTRSRRRRRHRAASTSTSRSRPRQRAAPPSGPAPGSSSSNATTGGGTTTSVPPRSSELQGRARALRRARSRRAGGRGRARPQVQRPSPRCASRRKQLESRRARAPREVRRIRAQARDATRRRSNGIRASR